MQRGDQLIIGAELIDTRTNRSLWGDQYNRKLSDVLAVQEDITRAISSTLRERLSGETKKPVARGGTTDPEGLSALSQGRYYWEKRTPDALEKSKDYFNHEAAVLKAANSNSDVALKSGTAQVETCRWDRARCRFSRTTEPFRWQYRANSGTR